MKSFNPIQTMQKFIVLILILTLLCSAVVCVFLSKHQSYSASMLIEYTGPKAELGLNPDDTPIDVSEIYSATVIDNVIKGLNLECSVEEIRSAVTVQEIIPLTETKRENSAIELNMEYSFIPTKYLVTYTADSLHSEEYAREVLDSILSQYYILYSQKYIENVAYPNNATNISLTNYDYIECVELLRNNINSITSFCMARDASFYSAKSGYSFTDLQLELEYLRDNLLYDLNVYILENRLTVDRSLLLQKEANRASQYEIKVANTKQHIKEQKAIVDQFAEKTLDQKITPKGVDEVEIITDVEANYSYNNIADTTYDALIKHYAQLLLEANYYESELALTQKVIKTFSKPLKESFSADAGVIAEQKLSMILEDFNSLYNAFVITVKDYYNVRSANYLSFNSNVETVSNINIKLYLVVAIFLFFVSWSCFFIVIDRLKEILQFINNSADNNVVFPEK